ncbi:MAG: dTMP kinase, partial [Candidatus Jordarchaeaceae archaeon]
IRNYLTLGGISPTVYALLFAADRMEHIEKVIKPLLSEGVTVVSDRYVESSIAYQAAEGLEIEWIENINRFAISPDLTILLDIDPETALARKKEFRDSFENVEFLKKVRQIYLERARAKKYPIINTNRDIETVHQDIVKCVEQFLNKAQNL